MIETIIIGGAVGAFAGFVAGALMAVNSRDGIWPDVWAGIIIFSTVIGAVLGAVEGVL